MTARNVFLFLLSCTLVPQPEQPPPKRHDPLAFNPESQEAWHLLMRASEKFEKHAGITPYADLEGTPIRIIPQTGDILTCAATNVKFYRKTRETVSVEIILFTPGSVGCFEDLSDTLAHEMIHAMRGWTGVDLGTKEQRHSTDGLFKETAGDNRFTTDTLTKLCEAVECNAFNPEK